MKTLFRFSRFLFQEGTIDMARHANTTWINNDTAVYLRQVKGLDVAQGHNRFQGNLDFDIYGTIDPTVSIVRSNGIYQLAA